MQPKLNFYNSVINKHGFASIITLILLPMIATLLSFVSAIVVLTSFKKEFRFICLNESLVLQQQLLSILQVSEVLQTQQINSYNNRAKLGSFLIADKLRKIKSAVEYKSLNVMYPEIEPHKPLHKVYTMAFDLEYTFVSQYRLSCGTKLFKENNKWKFEVIY